MANDSKKDDKTDKDESAESKTILGEALKKVFTAGVSAAFMTEESIRAYLGEIKLPKEILSMLIQSAAKSKDEITGRITKEAIAMLQKIDFTKEMTKFAENHKFKIHAEVEIIKKNNLAVEIKSDS